MKQFKFSSQIIEKGKYLFYSIYLSLCFCITVQFPTLQDLPLATYSELPDTPCSRFLNHLRILLDAGYGMPSALLTILIFISLIKFHQQYAKKLHQCKKSTNIVLILLSIVFAFLNVSGLCMYHLEKLEFFRSKTWAIVMMLVMISHAFVFYLVSFILLDQLEHAKVKPSAFDERKAILSYAGVILLAWLPWIISYYPASMSGDTFRQLHSYVYIMENHHPWFSTTVLGLFYSLGRAIHSPEAGIFLYVFLRDILISLVFAKTVVNLRKTDYPRILHLLVLLFYAFTPVFGAYAKHSFKDTAAMGLFSAFMLEFAMWINAYRSGKTGLNHAVYCGLFGLLASLFRNNIIYCVMPALLLSALFTFRKQGFKAFVPLMILSVYFLYSAFIFNVVGVRKGSANEAFSLPLQQVARVVKEHGDSLNPEYRDSIDRYLYFDELAGKYDPILSDPVKGKCIRSFESAEDESAARKAFLKTWVVMSVRYPLTYLEAAVAQSYGYYAFTPNMAEGSGNKNSGMTIFDWIGGKYDGMFETFSYREPLSFLRKDLHAYAKVWDKIPLISLLDVCAAYTWVTVLIALHLLLRKDWLELSPVLSSLLLILSCIASPVNDCFRYFIPAAASLPSLLLLVRGIPEKESGRQHNRISVLLAIITILFVFLLSTTNGYHLQ